MKMNRRSFIVSSAAVTGGLAVGFNPFQTNIVRAQDGSPELTAWVVIQPNDTVIIRMARSEMGQGTITGLAQMVAEELECDWNKVTYEYPTPATHLDAGTFHWFAAAWTSITRAVAPPWRTYSCEVRMPRLPPVEKSPQARLRATL